MARFGPSRAELWVRLAISLAGLALLVGALIVRGAPGGMAFVEIVVIAGAFFGGSAVWCGYRLWRRD